MEQQYLAPNQVAAYFPGLTAERLARWRWAKTGPAYAKAGRQVLYKRDDLERFIGARVINDVGAA